MVNKLLIYLLIFAFCKESLQDDQDNLVEVEDTPIEQIKNEILSEDNLQQIGGVFNNFMQSDMGKQLGDTLMNGITSGNNNVIMSQLLQGVGSLMQQNTANPGDKRGETGNSQGAGLNPELIGSMLGMLMNQQSKDKNAAGFDMGTVMQMMMGLTNTDPSAGYMGLTNNILGMVMNSLSGVDMKKKEQEHADHSWMLPPFVEKIHIYVDNFVNSEMGAALLENTGANKALKIFSDEDGKFSYEKFVELFENQSFRKHWISMATKRIAAVISFFADPYTQRKFMTTFTMFINNFLKGQGVPKTALFDSTRPTESLTAIANHYSKMYLGQKLDSKKYIQPVVAYIQELLEIAEEKGLVGTAVDSDRLSHKIADTINLEIIEPVVRVNRAYRFAKRVPKCDRYVMCLVNQVSPDEVESIPGLKQSLSRVASVVASWFISDKGDTSFWSLYHVIIEENNCQARYLDECHDFHVEEIKVTTEYVHNEL